MEHAVLVMLGISILGFVIGLAGKARSLKNGSLRKSEFYVRLTTISLILMFVFVIVYQFIK